MEKTSTKTMTITMANYEDNEDDDGWGWLVAGLGLFLLSTLYSRVAHHQIIVSSSHHDHHDYDDGDGDDDNVDYEDGWSGHLRICCLVLSFDYICIIPTIEFCTLLLKPTHKELLL